MRANLELTQGQIFAEAVQMALAPALGRDTAHALVARRVPARGCASGVHLRDVLRDEPQRRRRARRRRARHASSIRSTISARADAFIDRVLARH